MKHRFLQLLCRSRIIATTLCWRRDRRANLKFNPLYRPDSQNTVHWHLPGLLIRFDRLHASYRNGWRPLEQWRDQYTFLTRYPRRSLHHLVFLDPHYCGWDIDDMMAQLQ